MKPVLSVIIPALNEQGNIALVVAEVRDTLARDHIPHEVIIVDGGSTDRTVAEAESAGARVVLQKRPGYGGALREGLALAAGYYVATLDADRSHPVSLVSQMWALREEADIIVASRFVPGGTSEAPGVRRVLSRILNLVFSAVLNVPVRDISSGFRLYRSAVLTPQRYTSEDFNILQEILIRAYCDGYSVAEVPLHYHKRVHGKSHAELARFARSYLKTLYRMWVLRNSVESADYDDRAFHSRIPLQLYWQRRRHAIVMGFMEGRDGVLDVGCGSSRIIQDLPDAVAVDILPRKLRFLRRTNRHRVCASTFQLPFGDHVFRQVIHSQVIEHVPLDPRIYRELNRVLHSNGILIIGTPDYGRIWWPITEYLYKTVLPNAYGDEHVTHYTRQSLIDMLANHGFRTLRYRYILGGELIIKAQKIEDLGEAESTLR